MYVCRRAEAYSSGSESGSELYHSGGAVSQMTPHGGLEYLRLNIAMLQMVVGGADFYISTTCS